MCSLKKLFFKISQKSQTNERLYYSLFSISLKVSNFMNKWLQHRFYFCEFCKFFKNSYFVKHPRTAASAYSCLVLSLVFGISRSLILAKINPLLWSCLKQVDWWVWFKEFKIDLKIDLKSWPFSYYWKHVFVVPWIS